MRYLSKGFAERGFGKLGKVLAVFFAIMCIGASWGGGNMYQVNQSLEQVVVMTGGAGSFFDFFLSFRSAFASICLILSLVT